MPGMKLIFFKMKLVQWLAIIFGLMFLVIAGVIIFSPENPATRAQTSSAADDYVFIGEYNPTSNACPSGYSPIFTSEHIGGNLIATCFKNNDGISENNNSIIAVGSKANNCPPSEIPTEKIFRYKKFRSEHIGGNYIRTCSKFKLAPPAIVVGEVSATTLLPAPCPIAPGNYQNYRWTFRSEHIGGNYIGTCVAPAPTMISVKLTANPVTGLPPFDSILTATVYNAIGFGAKVYFEFDCNNGQTFTRETTTSLDASTASVTQTVTCNYIEFKSYAPTVKVYQGDAPLTYDTAVVKATTGLTDVTTGEPTQLKAEIKKIKIREVAP